MKLRSLFSMSWIVPILTILGASATSYLIGNSYSNYYLILVLLLILPIFFVARGEGITEQKLVASIVFLYIAFPTYGPDPYKVGAFSAFDIAKYVFLLFTLILCMRRIGPSITQFAYLIICSLGMLGSMLTNQLELSLRELIYFFAISTLMANAKGKELDITAYFTILMSRIFILIPIMYIFQSQFNLLHELPGGTKALGFGHWIGFLVAFSTLRIIQPGMFDRMETRILYSVFWTFSLWFLYPSMQSSHYLIIVIVMLAAIVSNKRLTVSFKGTLVSLCIIVFLFLPALLDFIDVGTWTYLKLSQTIGFLAGDFVLAGNSVLIRVAQLEAMFAGSLYEIILGRGPGGVYELPSIALMALDLHDRTFPLEEIATGRFVYVHETTVFILKTSGIVGLMLISWVMLRKIRRAKNSLFLVTTYASALLFLIGSTADAIFSLVPLALALATNSELAFKKEGIFSTDASISIERNRLSPNRYLSDPISTRRR